MSEIATTATPVLRVRGIEKSLGGIKVLKGIDLDVPEGQVLAIMGPSGGGKSTLLRCINLLTYPDAGSCELDGEDLAGAKKARLAQLRSRIGMVFQHFNLFPHLTALGNCTIAPEHVLGIGKEEATERARAALTRVNLEPKMDSYPRHLSGGQQQRVAIARALTMEPRLMLFDEPTSALDAEMVAEVVDVMNDLAHEQLTMIVVSHEVGFVRGAADRVLLLADGQIVEDRPGHDLLDDPREERTRQFIEKIRH
jgi:polar amino acid transport system ATP-binding protein